MSKVKVLAEIQRDYAGTYKAWEEAVRKGDYMRANELRETLVGMRELHDRVVAR